MTTVTRISGVAVETLGAIDTTLRASALARETLRDSPDVAARVSAVCREVLRDPRGAQCISWRLQW